MLQTTSEFVKEGNQEHFVILERLIALFIDLTAKGKTLSVTRQGQYSNSNLNGALTSHELLSVILGMLTVQSQHCFNRELHIFKALILFCL